MRPAVPGHRCFEAAAAADGCRPGQAQARPGAGSVGRREVDDAGGDDAEMSLRACGQTRYRPAGQAKATYGIDGCAITLPVLASLQVGPAAMTVWALRRKRRSLGVLAGAAWLAAAGV